MTSRTELDGMGREALIALAASLGVANARALPRVDLVDEILLRRGGEGRTGRGLFGLARDLLARVVERGLHLPDAAERADASVSLAPPPPRDSLVPGTAPASVQSPAAPTHAPRPEIATVTLASIYASQGLSDRALETVARVLAKAPTDRAALSLQAHLRGAPLRVPATVRLARSGAQVRIEWNAGDVGAELAVLAVVQVSPSGVNPRVQRTERMVAARGTMELDVGQSDVVHAAVGFERGGQFVARAHA